MEEKKTKDDSIFMPVRFEGVTKFKSIKRAWRRGHISVHGILFPRRPFNNRDLKKGTRPFNKLKKTVYKQLRYGYRAN